MASGPGVNVVSEISFSKEHINRQPKNIIIFQKELGSTEKPGVVKTKPSTSKSLKKEENANEVGFGEEHLNEVVDFDEESEADQMKSVNETNKTIEDKGITEDFYII